MKAYRIKHPIKGFAKKGSNTRNRFSKTGHIWQGTGPLRNHFRLFTRPSWNAAGPRLYVCCVAEVYTGCTLLETDLETGEQHEYDLVTWWNDYRRSQGENV